MSKHKQHEEEHENSERWLLTYSDLITLMMAFFCILFAMASVDADKFKALSQSLVIAFSTGGTSGGSNMITNFSGSGFKETVKVENDELASLVKDIQKYAARMGMSKSIATALTARGLVINLADSVLFDSGKADLTPQAQEILDKLAEILFKNQKQIRVEGHTDNIPINSAKYRSNWQLSTERATNVIMYWISKNPAIAERLSAGGYGEYHPIAPNDTPEGRALNRRVDIVVLRSATPNQEGAQPATTPGATNLTGTPAPEPGALPRHH